MPFCEFDRGKWLETMKKVFLSFVIIIISAFIVSCSTPPFYFQKETVTGVYHLVKKGESFWSIARAYKINLQDLAEANNIKDPGLLQEGTVLFIPEAKQIIENTMPDAQEMVAEVKIPVPSTSNAAVKTARKNDIEQGSRNDGEISKKEDKKSPPAIIAHNKAERTGVKKQEDGTTTESASAKKYGGEKSEQKQKSKNAVEEKEKIQFDKKRFIWPVRGTVKTRFGIQPTDPYHNYTWIKIVSNAGAKVMAAASGTVIFSSRLPKFGETIIIKHVDNFATVYEHLKIRHVKTDQNVKQGEIIALLGETDEAGDIYMNFEVRINGKARNPLFFLP